MDEILPQTNDVSTDSESIKSKIPSFLSNKYVVTAIIIITAALIGGFIFLGIFVYVKYFSKKKKKSTDVVHKKKKQKCEHKDSQTDTSDDIDKVDSLLDQLDSAEKAAVLDEEHDRLHNTSVTVDNTAQVEDGTSFNESSKDD